MSKKQQIESLAARHEKTILDVSARIWEFAEPGMKEYKSADCYAQVLRDKRLDVDVYFMGSTMEETSSAGAKTGTFALEPDWCVAVDVTHGKTPDASPKDYTLVLGEGPVIGVGPNCTRWMTERLKAKAKALELSYQLEVMPGHSGTNGWPMQISREGVATAVLSLPLRYMHSPIEVLDWKDVEGVAALLAAFAQELGKEAETLC